MRIFLVFVLSVAINTLAQQTCFVFAPSTVRRDALGVAPSASQKGCNIQCIYTPGCEACMYYADKGTCVTMGPAYAPPPGQCPVPYNCYEKRTSGCPSCSAPPVDSGYTPGPCTRASDVAGPPVTSFQVCTFRPVGQRKIILDAIDHDGNRKVLENHGDSQVKWDPYVCSWYYRVSNIHHYFKSAKCVWPPATPLLPSCDCAALPTEPPMLTYALHGTQPTPAINTVPPCPNLMQVRYTRVEYTPTNYERVLTSASRSIYCAMGQWIFLLDNGPPNYSEYAIDAATCVV